MTSKPLHNLATPCLSSPIMSRLCNAFQFSDQSRWLVPRGFHHCHCHCLYNLTPAASFSKPEYLLVISRTHLQYHVFQESFPSSSQLGLVVYPPSLYAPFVSSYSNCHPAWKLPVFLCVFKTRLRALGWQGWSLSFSMWHSFIPSRAQHKASRHSVFLQWIHSPLDLNLLKVQVRLFQLEGD